MFNDMESEDGISIYLKQKWFYMEDGEMKNTALKPNHPLVVNYVLQGNCYKHGENS